MKYCKNLILEWAIIKLQKKQEEWQLGKYSIATFIHITVFTNNRRGNWSHIAKRGYFSQ